MDATRFDTLARSLHALPSRRTLLGLGLGGMLSVAGIDLAGAKKKWSL